MDDNRSRVVFHADDFGETVGITRAIILAITEGVVRSSTIMANMPGSVFGMARAVELADQASFGVHVNLCQGRPLTRAPRLTDESGRFLAKHDLARRAFTGALSRQELRQEVEAQVDRVRSQGIRVSHLDGHKHLHMLPLVRDAVIEAAARFDIQRVRVTSEHSWQALRSPQRMIREILARSTARRFSNAKLRHPARVRDLADHLGSDPHSFAARLGSLRGLTEVICHPGTSATDAETPGECKRSRDLEFLTRPELREALDEAGVEIVSFWEV